MTKSTTAKPKEFCPKPLTDADRIGEHQDHNEDEQSGDCFVSA